MAILGSVFLKGQSPSLLLQPEDVQSKLSGTEVPSQQWNKWFNEQVDKYEESLRSKKTATVPFRIPVVFHVIHTGQAVGTYPNIDSAQINSQIRILNADFSGAGLNVGNVPAAFANLVANTNIQFCRAYSNPAGGVLPEPGIDRQNSNSLGRANPTSTNNIILYMNNSIKPITIWDPTKYLNIWLSDKSTSVTIMSFATYPAGTILPGSPTSGGTAADDGIWLWSKVVGNRGAVVAPYDKGRIATKEVAHWLGVRNIWGDGNCLDDYCSDTPWHKQPNTGCPTYPSYVNRCGLGQSPNGEMTMNFMDETDEACKYMFTPRQALRMQTAMGQGTFRSQLGLHNKCTYTQTAMPALARFEINEIPCVGEAFTAFNLSTGWPNPTYQWTSAPNAVFNPGPSSANPAVTFPAAATYTIYMTATNTTNVSSYSMVVTPVTTCPAKSVCLDTIRMIRPADTLVTYKAANNSLVPACASGFAGYLTGNNCYQDREYAQFIPSSTYGGIVYPQVNSVIVLFDSLGTKSNPINVGTQINCILYSGTAANGPNSQLAIRGDSLKSIVAKRPKTTNIVYVGSPSLSVVGTQIIPFRFDFATPVVLAPNGPGFYAAVQTPITLGDSIRIFSNKKINLNNTVDSSAWVLTNPANNWRTMKSFRNAAIQLAIMPQITCRPVVGIKEIATEFTSNISVMPNPSSGQFNLVFTFPTEQNLSISIYNAMGQLILSEKIDNVSHNMVNLNLAGKPDGIYFIDMANGNERITKKIIISQ